MSKIGTYLLEKVERIVADLHPTTSDECEELIEEVQTVCMDLPLSTLDVEIVELFLAEE